MKLYIRNSIILSFFITLSLFNAKDAKSQILPLALGDSVNVYGPFQDVVVAGQLLKIKTKLLKHFGTTCIFEIEITNTGQKEVASKIGLLEVGSNNIGPYTSTNLSLKPNYYAVFKLEIRECAKKRQKNEILSCMACSPRLGFYNPFTRK